MKKHKREIKKTLPSGRLQKQVSQHGIPNGERVDQAGIYNVQQWQPKYLERN